jgi:TonB family protein
VAGPPPADSQAPAEAAAEAATAQREERVAVAPARLKGGALPQIPIMAVSGGEVVLEVSISRTGRVTGVKPLRHTAPFTDAMAAAVRSWTFAPAEDALAPPGGAAIDPATRRPMDSTVLVVGVFRPPALFAATLGEPPAISGAPSGAAPVLAGPIEMPAYPVSALNDGVVLVELDLAASGGVEGIGVVRSAAAFDQLALAAASALAFRPARVHGRAAPAFVYVAFAFRQPIT